MRPDSNHYYPGTLGNQPIAVQFHAGSHYVALRLLEGYLPKDKIKLVNYGSPEQRFEAMMNGDVEAAAVMEPWIALGEKLGCRAVCEGHYLGAESASDDMDPETFQALNRAVANAVDMINADKKKYIHYMLDEIPEKYAKQLTPDDFYLPRLRYVEIAPYSQDEFERAYNWMVSWDLVGDDANYENLVSNRL